MRLDKFIAKSTAFTKPEVMNLILGNHIKVNDVVIVSCSFQVHENNHITLNNQVLVSRPFRYILLNKPVNVICANVDQVYPSVLNLLRVEKSDQVLNTKTVENVGELHIAGRLDVDTTGLILITDDGRWTFQITLPNNGCKKVYRVTLSRPFNADLKQRFKKGIQLQGEASLTLPADIEQVDHNEVLLTITEGKYHQVKRMFAAVGNRVIALHREQIGDVKLDVKSGEWRYLTDFEVASFL